MWPISQLLGRSCHVFPLPSLTTRTFSLGQWSLIRMNFLPKPKTSDRWDNKRAMFGVYDNIGILDPGVCDENPDTNPADPDGFVLRTAVIPELMIAPAYTDFYLQKRGTAMGAKFAPFYANLFMGDFKAHPRELIIAPSWLKGWKGNELQRCIRKRQMVGARMFYHDRENLNKRIRFLYKRFNRYGKHR